MRVEELRRWVAERGEWSFARSTGPGGQNVNKTSTSALLRLDLSTLEGLSEAERALLRERLGPRLTESGELLIRARDTRSQIQNREAAAERAIGLILAALAPRVPRKATKPTKGSVRRRLETKARLAGKKRSRAARGAEAED